MGVLLTSDDFQAMRPCIFSSGILNPLEKKGLTCQLNEVESDKEWIFLTKEPSDGNEFSTDKRKEKLQSRVLLATDPKHPIIVVAKKLTGFLP